jgi:hypothetical protein
MQVIPSRLTAATAVLAGKVSQNVNIPARSLTKHQQPLRIYIHWLRKTRVKWFSMFDSQCSIGSSHRFLCFYIAHFTLRQTMAVLIEKYRLFLLCKRYLVKPTILSDITR